MARPERARTRADGSQWPRVLQEAFPHRRIDRQADDNNKSTPMRAPAHLRGMTTGVLHTDADPFLKPQSSLRNRLARALWGLACAVLFRPSPRPLHAWRAALLRSFGATLGPDCHIYPKARIWAPWNLVCEDVVAIADEAIVYNPALVRIGSHAVISQQ